MKISFGQSCEFTYTNWRGRTSLRHAIPYHIWFGVSSFHPRAEWFLAAFDIDKMEQRDFALSGIHVTNVPLDPQVIPSSSPPPDTI